MRASCCALESAQADSTFIWDGQREGDQETLAEQQGQAWPMSGRLMTGGEGE